MSERTRKWWNVLGKLLDWFRDNLEDQVPQRSSMHSDTAVMRTELDRLAEKASYAMALVDTKREELSNELKNYDKHMACAKQFASEQKEDEAKRCLFLAHRSTEKLNQLNISVNELQTDADLHASVYQQKKGELEKRDILLPQVEQQLTLQALGKNATADTVVAFEDAQRSFDSTVDAVNLTSRQQKNKVLLMTDPHQAIDNLIVDSLEKGELEKAYNSLLNMTESKTIDESIQSVFLETDSVAKTRLLLAKPAHESIVGDAIRSTFNNSTRSS